MAKAARSVGLVLWLAVLVSCGGGGGGGDAPPPGSPGSGGPGPGTPAIPAVPTATPVLYLMTSADASSYFPGANLTLEADNQALLRYVPSTGALHQMDTNFSPSYAPNTLRPFTQDNRLFSVNDYSSSFYLYPIDLVSNAQTKTVYVPVAFPTGCIALVGDDLIFRDSASQTWKKLANISTAPASATPVVIGSAALTPTTRCYFNVGTTQGRLLDVEFVDNSGATADTFTVRERSTATGAAVAILGSFAEPTNPADYSNYLFGFDNGFFYIVRKKISTGRIEIWRSSIFSVSNTPVLRASLIPNASFTGPVLMDINNGFVAMLVYNGTTTPLGDVRLLTYNDNTGSFVDRTVGRGFYDVEVLFLP